ncbi:hypothetical protein BZG36_03008 [Bifiguratus adelaidae]|uniref:B-related factor 1 n=1 Tax=Bifiguratus adelaidae TaxID=1938954 RepID=A0A261XZN7_9FUNG|nr:hypothetical protein BZG36_03008 [Bifiguratus adelaidae]
MSSTPTYYPSPNELIGSLKPLKTKQRRDDALKLLQRMAANVKPIMKRRGWKVERLEEFFPKNPNLLGLNVNRTTKICIRLRPHFDENAFLDYDSLLGTMLHELTHIVHGPHDAKFYALLEELNKELDELLAKGITGEEFGGTGRKVGGRGPTNLSRAKIRELALQAAERRRNIVAILGEGGGRKLEGKPIDRTSIREIAAAAAERRMRDAKWCGGEIETEEEEREIEDREEPAMVDFTLESDHSEEEAPESSTSAKREPTEAHDPADTSVVKKAKTQPSSNTIPIYSNPAVLEENRIVAEVGFNESSSGAVTLAGSYVAADRGGILSTGPGRRGNLEPREATINNGRREILIMATGLHLPERYRESAQRFFNLAITNNFVKGRKTKHVAAICLYVVCRQERSSHMLIDFSDLLQVNVFVLGATFLKFVKLIHFPDPLPLVDPSLYISRFASMLDFGPYMQAVAQDAVRLVQRMNRDWIQIGRRPAGICGACLYIAAQMNGFTRSRREILQVVKIGESTLVKRLNEFSQTPSGSLSVRDFRSVWLEDECDPPAFSAGKQPQSIEIQEDEAAEVFEPATERERYEVENENADRIDQPEDIEKMKKEKQELQDAMNNVLDDEHFQKLSKEYEEKNKPANEDPASLSDVDDGEIESVMLDEEEVRNKTQVWYEFNKDWLVDQAIKKRKIEEDKKMGVHRPKPKRKSKKPQQPYNASSPAEAAAYLARSKPQFSKKINYDAFKSLFKSEEELGQMRREGSYAEA